MELQGLYDRIICGYTIVADENRLYFIYDPRPKDKYFAQFYISTLEEELEFSEIPSQLKLDVILRQRNIWGEKQEKLLAYLEEQVQHFKKQTSTPIIERELKKLQYDFDSLLHKKQALSTNTKEYIISIEKYKYLLFLLTYDENHNRIWQSLSEFKSTDDSLVNKLMNQSFFNRDINEKQIRLLARSEPWRSTWMASKKCGQLFSEPIGEITDYQRVLVSWSIVYDSVYEHPDCPSDDIINDDNKLDSWLQEQGEKRKQETEKRRVDKILSQNDKINNAQEAGIIVDSPEAAQKVYNLNDKATLSQIRKRMDLVKEKGTISELDMPDTKLKLQMEMNKMEIQKVTRN